MANNLLDKNFKKIIGKVPKKDKEDILRVYELAYEFYESDKSTEWNIQYL